MIKRRVFFSAASGTPPDILFIFIENKLFRSNYQSYLNIITILYSTWVSPIIPFQNPFQVGFRNFEVLKRKIPACPLKMSY